MDPTRWTALEPWLLFAAALAALVVADRLVAHTLVALVYRLTGNLPVAMLVYALVVWPGTVLHEVSHWLAARLLGVPASAPHLLPSRVDEQGRMVLGHVMVQRSDIVRRSLIGAAPLVVGSIVVALLARYAFDLPLPAIEGEGLNGLRPLLAALPSAFRAPDAWLFGYALFAIANAMLPSESDREAWPALVFFAALVGALLFFTVGLPSLPPAATPWLLRAVAWLTLAYVVTVALDALLLLVLVPLERVVAWLRGA